MSLITDAINEIYHPQYRDDIARIVQVALKHGYSLTMRQAEDVWEKYSESMFAGWMVLPDDDDKLWLIIG
jgi:hypothetical protein